MAKPANWQGRSVLDAKHQRDLDLDAAIFEFHYGHNRADAEQKAYDKYRRQHHTKAAAHHLNGMKAANASGANDDAHRHYDMYVQHIKALGLDPNDAVPLDVRRIADDDKEGCHSFKAHGADQFLVTPKPGQ